MSDQNAENRKQDHIALAFESRTELLRQDTRFYYEPMLAAHPSGDDLSRSFLGKKLQYPMWISSMTGGTAKAGTINRNLARACRDFGIGMGLGSCRILLDTDQYLPDFDLRDTIGNDLPFFANLGVAQVEELLDANQSDKILRLLDTLRADGLILHVNPLQEWLQPEGDRFKKSPLETLDRLLEKIDRPLIVKEVGQGMGPESIRALLQRPIAAFDFGAYGGTNFSKLEMLRNKEAAKGNEALAFVGHSAEEMTGFVEDARNALGDKLQCTHYIVSGGIRDFVDGYYHLSGMQGNVIYAQGSAMLEHAQGDYSALEKYIKTQAEGLTLCARYLRRR